MKMIWVLVIQYVLSVTYVISFVYSLRLLGVQGKYSYLKYFIFYTSVAFILFLLFNYSLFGFCRKYVFDFFNNFSFIYHFLFLTSFIFYNIRKPLFRVAISLVSISVLIASKGLLVQTLETSSSNLPIFPNVGLAINCLFYYYEYIHRDEERDPFHDPVFIIIAGIFLLTGILSPALIVLPLLLKQGFENILITVAIADCALHAFMHLCFCRGFVLALKKIENS